MMIVFCTPCRAEIDSMAVRCSYCGSDLTTDLLSHKEKQTVPSIHHLPTARLRICWLLEANRIKAAVPQLIPVAEHDEDLFVQRRPSKPLLNWGMLGLSH